MARAHPAHRLAGADPAARAPAACSRAHAQGLALVQFTSGSTGQHLGVCLTHQM
jgi:acyl-CoA synthetase (AMP-forming)/AMP-acid ligase II